MAVRAAVGRFDRDDIAGFIDLLPETLDGIPLRHAIEPRHESFRDDTFFELCRARNIAVVFEDSDEYPCIEADTADFAYARLQRMNEDIPTGYDEAALDALPKRGARLGQGRPDAYIFMINGAKVRAPAARYGAAGTASLTKDRCALPTSRSASACSRQRVAWAKRLLRRPRAMPSRSTRIHGDVLIDFSAPDGLEASLDRAISAGIPILIGTTASMRLPTSALPRRRKQIAVLRAANTSLGVALLAELVERAARVLGPDWDIEIAETHHRMKADAPSGTALLLGEAAARGRGTELDAERGRDGTGLEREAGRDRFCFASRRNGRRRS